MYKIFGDGSYQNTKIQKDGELIPYNRCEISISEFNSFAKVDDEIGRVEFIVLVGIYTLVGEGFFHNTKICLYDIPLRGVQAIDVRIEKDQHTLFNIVGVFLPNIIEGEG